MTDPSLLLNHINMARLHRNAANPKKPLTALEIAEQRIGEWNHRQRERIQKDSMKVAEARRTEHAPWLTYKAREDLHLADLGLTAIPKSLCTVRNVGHLNLALNSLTELPEWIGEIKAEIIDLARNRLKRVPPELGSSDAMALYLDQNDLQELPESLLAMPNLHTLSLHGNPGLGIPQSIIATQNAKQILGYYFESHGDKGRPLQELKMLLVGRGKAGKTTLIKQLAGGVPDPNESETHSIVIRELILECPSGPVRTRAWDFGGQEILHSTHQFFLTERSLYLVVLEPRSGLAQRDAEYWLKLIEAQGGGSPAIVVMNWSRNRRWKVDEVKLRRKFPFIIDFISVDALHGDGVDELQGAIIQTVESWMSDVWLPFPTRWREIKTDVAGMSENFLTYEQFSDLCVRSGETDPEKQADLAAILHALGLVLYFGNDPRLHDTRVLNPRWVTGGVYAVIRSPFVASRYGQLTVKDMPRVLQEAQAQNVVTAADYPPDTHAFILELMRAFQLCYANDEEGEAGAPPNPAHYLVPELLPEFEPEMPERWEEAPVRLRYRYEVLTPGLLPRFIVRTHGLSEGAPHWRHGVVLRHGEASALIREESDRPELFVFVHGADDDTRRVLVTMVRRELEALHTEMKIAPVEDLELTGEAERWIGVKALHAFDEPGQPTKRLPIQPEGTADVNVTLELDKLEPAQSRAIDRDPATAPAPVRVFVSYAHKDERQLQRLDLILDVLELQHGLSPWRDKRLVAGDEWDAEIRRRVEEMDIFLFIASQRSLVSPYIRDHELRRAQERRAAGEVEIVTVALERCAVDDDPVLGKLQRLASGYESIADASPRSAGWEQVRRDLLPVIRRVRQRKESAAKQVHT